MSAAPIEDGAIAVEGDRIVGIGPRSELTETFPQANVENFNEAAIIPGLVNAHTHLELTAMRGFLDEEEGDFFSWLRKLTLARMEKMTPNDLYVSAQWGACEALRAGVTSVGDASSSGYESLKAISDAGLRGIVFQESFGPDPGLAQENLAELQDRVARIRKVENSRVKTGVSPHSPYTVSAPQLRLISEFALLERLPVMMHAAESLDECSLLRNGEGTFARGLAARGIGWNAPGVSPIQYLRNNQVLETRPLLAHCIRVDERDLGMLADAGASIAHCPKSNAKLGHGRAPLGKFLEHGLGVGLGSDSVASNNTCDLLEEARFATLLSRQSENGPMGQIGADVALRIATMGGAQALGLGGKIGELKPGLHADLTVVSLAGVHQLPSYDPVSTLLFASSGRDVVMTVVAGTEVFREGRVLTVDEVDLRKRVKVIAEKLIA